MADATADAIRLKTYWESKMLNQLQGATMGTAPTPNYVSVGVVKISNGYIVHISGYQDGKSLHKQVYAADGGDIGDVVSLAFKVPNVF